MGLGLILKWGEIAPEEENWLVGEMKFNFNNGLWPFLGPHTDMRMSTVLHFRGGGSWGGSSNETAVENH